VKTRNPVVIDNDIIVVEPANTDSRARITYFELLFAKLQF
jgi:translation initiation factor IF-1